jgi:hypothetical protein
LKRLPALLWMAVFAGLLAYAAFTAWLGASGLAYPYQLDYGEGVMLDQARLIWQGQGIYKGLEGYPYAFSNYPPLLQTLAALLIPLLGVSYATGRIWNVLAVVALAALIYHVVRVRGGDRRASALGALAFVGSPYIYHWAPLFRVDLPGLLLSALGIAVLAGSGKTVRPSWAPFVAGLLLVASLYTKHSFLAAPAAAFLYLLGRDRRASVALMATCLAVGGGLFLALNWSTGGAFAFDLITTNVNPFNLSGLLSQIRDFGATFAILILLAVAGAIFRVRAAVSPGSRLLSALPRLSVWDFYFVTALATVVLAGKVGSWENYFFEPLFAICLYAGLGIGDLRSVRSGWQPALSVALPLALLLQLALMFHTPAIAAQVMADDFPANQRLSLIVAAAAGPVLSEDMGLLVTNGRPVSFFGFEYTQLARMGLWDQSWELSTLRRQQSPLVILEAGTRENPDRYHRFTRQFLSELDRGYALTDSIGKYRLYRRSSLSRILNVDFGGQVTLAGYRLDSDQAQDITTIRAGSVLSVSLLWQAAGAMTNGYTVYVHLLDASGRRWAQHDGVPFGGIYPTTRWDAGETVRDVHPLLLPAALPGGRYILHVGLYDTVSQAPLQSSGRGDVTLATVYVGGRPVYSPARANTWRLGDAVSLVGFDLAPAAGGTLPVTLYWRTDTFVDQDYTVFIQILGADGKPVAQSDAQPESGGYPTSLWQPGETVRDSHPVAIPAGLPTGEYRLMAGMYLLASGQRLPVAGGGDAVSLGTVRLP